MTFFWGLELDPRERVCKGVFKLIVDQFNLTEIFSVTTHVHKLLLFNFGIFL